MVAGVDHRSHDGLALRDVLHRHRIQVGALVTVNAQLAKLALEMAAGANFRPERTDGLRRFLETLSAYGNVDLRADLQPAVNALTAP
jgi:hypothetical protein